MGEQVEPSRVSTFPINSSKLAAFDIFHHATTRKSFSGHMSWWQNETTTVKTRCHLCWLQYQHCYCPKIQEKRELFNASGKMSMISRKASVLMYYHYLEVGRSANTAHVFEALTSPTCEQLLFGDSEKEIELFTQMKQEFENDEVSTCILYPATSSVLLSEWIESRPKSCSAKPIRIIALDGTYTHARHIFNHLKKALAVFNVPIPLVKLDLENGSCRSAMLGIMKQPGKDKLCTYQAIVMAMLQVNVDRRLCEELFVELDKWIAHILACKIKMGKSAIKNAENCNFEPPDFVREHLEKYPPKPRKKNVTHENIINDKKTMSPRTKTEVKVPGSEENLLLILEKTKKFYTYSTLRV